MMVDYGAWVWSVRVERQSETCYDLYDSQRTKYGTLLMEPSPIAVYLSCFIALVAITRMLLSLVRGLLWLWQIVDLSIVPFIVLSLLYNPK